MKHAELRALIGRAPVIKRGKGGRIQWTPSLQDAVRDLFMAGVPLTRASDLLGILPEALARGVKRYDLGDPPTSRVFLYELAAQWGVSQRNMVKYVTHRNIPITHWRGCPTITQAEAAALTAARQPVLSKRPPGMLTTAQIADLWGYVESRVRARLKHAPRTLYRPPHQHAVIHLFHLRDISPYAPPVRLRSTPAGHLTVDEFAALIGAKSPAVMKWVESGCPVTYAGVRRAAYVHPERVLTWLTSRKDRRMRVHETALRVALECREAA